METEMWKQYLRGGVVDSRLLLNEQKGLSISHTLSWFFRQMRSTSSVHLTATWRAYVDFIKDSTLWEDLAIL